MIFGSRRFVGDPPASPSSGRASRKSATIFSVRSFVRTPPPVPPSSDIALVEPPKISIQPFIDGTNEILQRVVGKVAVLVDRLDTGSVHGQQLAPKEVEPSAQQYEVTEHGSKNSTIVTPEVGDGLEEMGLLFKAEGNPSSLSGRSVDELCPNRVRLPDPIQISSRSCLIHAEDRAAVAINEGRDAVIGDAVHVHRIVTRLV
jgi:hypothetical protein